MNVPKIPKNTNIYICDNCKYKTANKKDFNKHLSTRKHLKLGSGSIVEVLEEKNPKKFDCKCGKEFLTHGGFWKHSKKCVPKAYMVLEGNDYQDISNNEIKVLTSLVMDVVKQNQELTKQMIELSKTSIITNNNNCNNNTINNKFNLQVFLNEKCKDALNISEFIDSLKISFHDLENVGTLGFVEGISKIFLKGLKQLDITKRPIHCSDLKRETMYIKEQNIWEKDSEDKNKLKMVIKNIAHKNTKVIPFWRDANPTCKDSQSKKNDQYMKILYESMGPCNEEEDNMNYDKIIKKLAKEVTIDKNV
jgi:hypothetical protein